MEKTPDWSLYCVLKRPETAPDDYLDQFDTPEFWRNLVGQMIKQSAAVGVGDLQDRQSTLAAQFELPTQAGIVEEFDGVNHQEAVKLVFVISLPLLVRSYAIKLQFARESLSVRVPNIYNLQLGLPVAVVTSEGYSYFDCKLRKLFVILRTKREEDKAGEEPKKIEIVDTKTLENDLLFDVV